MIMASDGWSGMQGHGRKEKQQKEAQIVVSCLFFDTCQGKKNQELGRDGGI